MHQAHYRYWPKGLPKEISPPQSSLYFNLEASAARYPGKAAIVFYDTVLDYARLKREVDAMAGYLQHSAGVKAGDRVLLLSQNCPQFVIAYYAILRADAVVVPVNAMSTPDELAHYLADSGARVAFAAQELCARLDGFAADGRLERVIVHTYSDYLQGPAPDAPDWVAAPRRAPDVRGGVPWYGAMAVNAQPSPHRAGAKDLCLLPYTSGTTGRPKGCRHTHGTMNASLAGSQLWRGLTSEAVIMGVAPMFHLLGMQSGMNTPILLGATVVVLPRWDREAAGRLMARHRVSVWAAPPAMVVDFFAQPGIQKLDLSSLAQLCGGGAPMPEAVAGMLASRYGITYNEAYGLTETASFLHCNPLDRNKRQCIGVPTFGVDTRIVDPATLAELPQGETGELVTRGAQVMLGYWNNPRADDEAFFMLDGQRYFRTGDLGRVDDEGYFYVTDRLKRMINVSGYKVWPAEVENTLYGHPAVHEACVIGVPDASRGETVKALLVLRDEARGSVREEDVIAWARTRMAAYKAPRIVEFVNALPKSSTGKILWRQLQEEGKAAA
ncbi:long-chain fatty acid--CoA ligase [Achromobacter xylosoxidans]|uniref:Long-chain fatty acid--CoA ligase n=1 Tax=Alcaligenes xylosoxydans xylosoxydans TaxID=85698 RepID=A0A424W500_ALCXX|nr:long-chain fatty acid--CoA ligase [Achromobacter xylosoxidans]MBC9906964.1 long-chain fatty acid--CoA ligase [Achromobacter xylosoxidans]MBD0872171.1 long-chain fatty acid--CoA ligase [Achromobacter xylosoxidans]QNP87540.1 long-chain fatty acid--CoA ligase [Achromobacter xylosoxidans]RPJ88376.1 long-chain fatty acid--CoA ligase [Achromobacter xylosoxidans]